MECLWFRYLLFGIKFGLNLFRIITRINTNEKQKQGHFITVLLRDLISPHTFFSYIFLNKTKFESKAIPQEVLLHEAAHAKQKHSLDVLFIELLQVVFWFNPLLYFIKKDIKLNHEFLADEAVLKHGIDSSTYQNTLLAFSSNATEPELANAINYSLIKKRFTIMKTQTSKKAVWLRSLLLLPLLGGLLFSFSGTKEVEKEIVPAMVFPEETGNQELKSIDDILTKEQKQKFESSQIMYTIDKDEYYKNATFKFKDKNRNVIAIKRYNELTEIEMKRLPSPPSVPMKKKPTTKKLTDWQDSSKYGIWVDSKKINNSDLNTISLSSFAHYFESKLEKNAKNYGKYYFQVNLFTHDEFNNQWKEMTEPLDKNDEIFFNFNSEDLDNVKENKANYSHTFIKIKKPILIVNGIVCNQCELNLTKKGVEKIILATTTGDKISSFRIKVQGKPTVSIKGSSLNTEAISNINTASLGSIIQLFDIKTVDKEKLPPVRITLVDKNAKNYSQSPIVKKGEQSTIPPPPKSPAPPKPANEHNKTMTKTQGYETIESLKKIEGDKTGYIIINEATHYYSKEGDNVKYFNRFGNEVNEEGVKLSDIQTDGSKVIPGQKITKVYKDDKVVSEFKKTWEDEETNIPEPPKPPKPPKTKSAYDYVKSLKKDNISYFYNNAAISYDQALSITQKEPKINISTHIDNGVGTVRFTSISKKMDQKREQLNSKRAQLEEEIQQRKKILEEKKQVREELVRARLKVMEERKQARQPLAEQFKGMEAKGTTFYYEGKKISEAKAIVLVKENPRLNMSMHNNNGVGTVHLSKKGIKTVNGKLVTD